jgi:iron complex transport system permease protein
MPALSERLRQRPAVVLFGLGLVAALAAVAFMTVGARGQWDFVLPFRGAKLAALVLVAYATAVSTILFQTVTANRILTPSLMGLDTMFALIQTSLVFVAGSQASASIDPQLLFVVQVVLMVSFSLLLYRTLFSGRSQSLHLVMLVGIVLGILFRSLSNLMQRIMAPNEFVVLQDRLFANFNSVNSDVLAISAVALIAVTIVGWRIMHTLDVLALGREMAVNLGIDYRATVSLILVIVSVMVAVSTALVGPVTFLGLLVASLAYELTGSAKHRVLLPAAVLLAIIMLVGGQLVLERLFRFDTALSIIVEFAGGLVFIFLILRGAAR